ncbi:hypothetical protein BSKO_12353 [Bryopsis sp. KO-2023]|nr:hypothetical protein BSKO_12353 [Bryopsis sp. KO-2023]
MARYVCFLAVVVLALVASTDTACTYDFGCDFPGGGLLNQGKHVQDVGAFQKWRYASSVGRVLAEKQVEHQGVQMEHQLRRRIERFIMMESDRS